MVRSFLIKYAEIGVKGKNRYIFEDKLTSHIHHSLKRLDGDFSVIKESGRIYAHASSEFDYDEVVSALQCVFGIAGICPMVQIEDKGYEDLKEQVLKFIDETYPDKNFTFKVDTRRANKQYPHTSDQINRDLGEIILETYPETRVDVHHPDVLLHVEIRGKNINLYSLVIPGPGGMPVGTNGKAMLLLSGGIDSPVATWMMAKRGMLIEAVHFHSYPYTSQRAQEKVEDLASIVASYCGRFKMHVINLLPIQEAIVANCPEEETTILVRRFMMRIAEKIANDTGCQMLITGENLGQVASQTAEALVVTDASVSLPVMRPLIAMDKVDIMAKAEEIGTFETSIQPYEDCCTVFLPKHPTTKPKLARILESESRLDCEALIEAAVKSQEIVNIMPK